MVKYLLLSKAASQRRERLQAFLRQSFPLVDTQQSRKPKPKWRWSRLKVIKNIVRSMRPAESACCLRLRRRWSNSYRCCLRCLRQYGGDLEIKRACRSKYARRVVECIDALDQLKDEFPNPERRPSGEQSLLAEIALPFAAYNGIERVIAKIHQHRWTDHDLAKIEGRPAQE